MATPENSRRYLDARLEAPEAHALDGGTVVAYSRPSPDKSDAPNEDAALIAPLADGGCVLAVADGMGGLPAGDQASELSIRALEECVVQAEAESEGGTLRAAILDGFEAGNRQIMERTSGSGTTLVVATIRDNVVRPFHVGDSVALVVGQRGRIKLLTLAHSPVAYAVEAGVLRERDAMHHAERHVVSNALGSEEMRIELGAPLNLAARDTVLLASDGLFDNVTTAEVVERIRCGPLGAAVAGLAKLARGRMERTGGETPSKPDDLTILAYRRTVAGARSG